MWLTLLLQLFPVVINLFRQLSDSLFLEPILLNVIVCLDSVSSVLVGCFKLIPAVLNFYVRAVYLVAIVILTRPEDAIGRRYGLQSSQ